MIWGSHPIPERQHGWARYQVAVYRAIEPLLDSAESASIERTWEDIRDSGLLAKYLKAGLDRERILLERPPDLRRAQEVSGDFR